MVKIGFFVKLLWWFNFVIGFVILYSDFILYFLLKGVRNWVVDWIFILIFFEEVKCIGLNNFSNICYKFFFGFFVVFVCGLGC